MKTLTVIGDVHGQTKTYQKLVRRLPEGQPSVQVGDMGIGFPGVGLHKMPDIHGWIRGNHDDPTKCRKTANYLGDYGYLPQYDIFYIGGAHSIDREWRTEGVSWWADEQISYQELYKVIDLYLEKKPKFVLSHECPSKIGQRLLAGQLDSYHLAKYQCCNSRTSQVLQNMFEMWKPKEWVFGHYHMDKSFKVEGTKFTCVAPMHTYELVLE